MNRVFLLLGSNQGETLRNLANARERIARNVGRIVLSSSLYRSAAWGMADQPDFCNQVVGIVSHEPPEMILQKILAIERQMGRVRREKWGPRLIDIDLLFCGNEVRDTPELRLPHPGIPERRFTLVPLAEIAPDFVHPLLGKTVLTLLQECRDRLGVGFYDQ